MQEFIVPDKHPYPDSKNILEHILSDNGLWKKKHELQTQGMYAHVNWEWVLPFVEWIGDRKVLEVMSGAGYLAKALREKGVDIIATDSRKWEAHMRIYRKEVWPICTHIEKISANNAIRKYGRNSDIVIISWPYMDPSAYHAIRTLHTVNPKAQVVYVGEWGGCTANGDFLDHFDPIQDDEFDKVADRYKTWYGLYDRMYLGKYKP